MKKRFFFNLYGYFALILFILVTSFCSRSSRTPEKSEEKSYSSFTFFTMDTVVEVKYRGKNKSIENKIEKEFNRIYRKYSPSFKTSIISKLNSSNGPMKLDKETLFLIKKSIYFNKVSKGVFDITIKPLIDIWGFEKGEKRVPAPETISRALKFVSSIKIKIKDDGVYLPEGFKIDLGGIAKGYAVDRAAEIFLKSGVKNFLVNAGGDLVARGVNDKGKNWVIGIQNPRGNGIVKIFSVKNKAVATSGDYQRYFISDGVRYCHILSPFTGYPFRYWISMTVIAEDCTTADALSTAFFGMERKDILKFVENNESLKIRFFAINPKLEIFTNFNKVEN